MNLHRLLVAVVFILTPAARADVVVDWNQHADAAIVAEGPATSGNPIAMARALAMMHLAMFEAIDAGKLPAAAEGVSEAAANAAANAAAHAVLAALYPRQASVFDKYYGEAMAALPDGGAKTAAIALGEQAAGRVLALRRDDGSLGSPDTYRPFTAPGTYVPTGLPVVSNVALRKPFATQGNAQFRPGPPPALDSAVWARDFNETKEWGGINSARRSVWQTETARFWEQLGPPAWNQVARSLAASRPMPLAARARVFALMNMAMFDAYLAVFDAKYHYNFWRPITAIRNGDQDGNAATERDPAWRPLIDTPPHPEYPCAHCAADGAAGAILKSGFGAGTLSRFRVTFAAMPGVARDYDSIAQLQHEIAMARIWGGVHYRNSNETGDLLGEKVGAYILQNALGVRAAAIHE